MATFLVFLDTTALYVAYPDLRADFAQVGPSPLSWVLNSYKIAVAALLIPAGRLADRVGREPPDPAGRRAGSPGRSSGMAALRRPN
jgi:MFS family permease